jgi:uncharacterized membrane protein
MLPRKFDGLTQIADHYCRSARLWHASTFAILAASVAIGAALFLLDRPSWEVTLARSVFVTPLYFAWKWSASNARRCDEIYTSLHTLAVLEQHAKASKSKDRIVDRVSQSVTRPARLPNDEAPRVALGEIRRLLSK